MLDKLALTIDNQYLYTPPSARLDVDDGEKTYHSKVPSALSETALGAGETGTGGSRAVLVQIGQYRSSL
jgi:hypothetical protein